MAAAINLAEVEKRIKGMRFRRKLFGGVDEADVWEQIRLLDQDYKNLYRILHQNYKKMIAANQVALRKQAAQIEKAVVSTSDTEKKAKKAKPAGGDNG